MTALVVTLLVAAVAIVSLPVGLAFTPERRRRRQRRQQTRRYLRRNLRWVRAGQRQDNDQVWHSSDIF